MFSRHIRNMQLRTLWSKILILADFSRISSGHWDSCKRRMSQKTLSAGPSDNKALSIRNWSPKRTNTRRLMPFCACTTFRHPHFKNDPVWTLILSAWQSNGPDTFLMSRRDNTSVLSIGLGSWGGFNGRKRILGFNWYWLAMNSNSAITGYI